MSEDKKIAMTGITVAVLRAAADGADDGEINKRVRKALLLAAQRRRSGQPIYVDLADQVAS